MMTTTKMMTMARGPHTFDFTGRIRLRTFCFSQKLHFREMMKHKRRPIEGTHGVDPGSDWQIRTMRVAEQVAKKHNVEIKDRLSRVREQWANHMVGPTYG